MKINILYEDKDLLVINKPAGISVHPDGKNIKEKTISDWFVKKYPKSKNVGESFIIERTGGKKEEIPRPGIVHRLDKETSGALILVKNQKTFLFLKNQFQNHKIEKIYHTFVYGFVKEPKASLLNKKRGVISAPIGRSPNDFRMWTAGRGAREPIKESKTEYIVLKRFTVENNPFSYLEVYPQTGRTHQIRVHLRYINYPIVSDPLYSGSYKKALDLDRLALHAYSISFVLPCGSTKNDINNFTGGEKKTVIAPYPQDFEKVIEKFIR